MGVVPPDVVCVFRVEAQHVSNVSGLGCPLSIVFSRMHGWLATKQAIL